MAKGIITDEEQKQMQNAATALLELLGACSVAIFTNRAGKTAVAISIDEHYPGHVAALNTIETTMLFQADTIKTCITILEENGYVVAKCRR